MSSTDTPATAVTLPPGVTAADAIQRRAQQAGPDSSATRHLHAGERITVDELAVHASAVAVWLRQMARAAETPAVAVELAETIDAFESTARHLESTAQRLAQLAEIVDGETPISTQFQGGKPWGAAAIGTQPDAYGPAPIVPTAAQVWHLRNHLTLHPDAPSTTYRAGLGEVTGWESRHAAQRRAIERANRLDALTRATACPRCGAEAGAYCRTSTGRIAEVYHRPRTALAEAALTAADTA